VSYRERYDGVLEYVGSLYDTAQRCGNLGDLISKTQTLYIEFVDNEIIPYYRGFYERSNK